MLPSIIYTVRFIALDGTVNTEQEYSSLEIAWDVFRMFCDSDSSGIYSRIDLISFDWSVREEHHIASLRFN